MSDLSKKKLIMKKMKAEAAIAELDYKIEERLEDIKRMKDHIELQKEQIREAEESLSEF